MVLWNFVQADVPFLLLGDVGVRCARRQCDDERLGEFDGVRANAVVVRVEQSQNLALHLGHHVPASLLHVRDALRAQ